MKNEKSDKTNEKNSRKIAIFHFCEIFCTTGSKMIKKDKNMKNND